MQRAFHRSGQERRQGRRARGVGPTKLPEDLPLTGDRGVEPRRDAEEVSHRGGVRADDDRVRGVAGLAQPVPSVHIPCEAREDLDAMTGDERERAPFDREGHRRREPFARRDRRVPLVERPRDDCVVDDVDRMRAGAGRKRDREVCLRSRCITEDARACQRARLTSGDTRDGPASPRRRSRGPLRTASRPHGAPRRSPRDRPRSLRAARRARSDHRSG